MDKLSCNTFSYDCPISILNLLTPTEDKTAQEWRAHCRKRAAAKKSPLALANLPIGSVIEFDIAGKVYRLVKHQAAFQFKRPFWYMPESNHYIPSKNIPSNYIVINTDKEAIA